MRKAREQTGGGDGPEDGVTGLNAYMRFRLAVGQKRLSIKNVGWYAFLEQQILGGIPAMARERTDGIGITERDNALILVVEDSETTLRLEKLVLEHAGYEVISARTGEKALEILKDADPALVLLDIRLPRMDGFATCESIRRSSQVPIIMVTAKNRDEDKVRGLEAGADDYVTKPFSTTELAARVRAVIRRYNIQFPDMATALSPSTGQNTTGLTASGLTTGLTTTGSPSTSVQEALPDESPSLAHPIKLKEGNVEGTVKVIVGTSGDVGSTVHFVDQLRQIPHFHVLRLQAERRDEKLVISLRLREPIPLKELLSELPGVSRVESVDVPADESSDSQNSGPPPLGFKVFLE
jgi:CheY-like chemotaxis protein